MGTGDFSKLGGVFIKSIGGIKMFCPNCGKKVSATADFCPYCGSKLDHSANEEERVVPEKQVKATGQPDANHQPAPSSSNGNGKKPGKKVPLILVGVIVVLLAAIAFMLGMRGSSKDSASTSSAQTTRTISKKNSSTSSSASRPTFNDQQKAAAILYYAKENESNRFWGELYRDALAKSTKVTANSLPDEATEQGDGTMHAYYPTGAFFGGATGYVMGTDGQTVYYYRLGPSPDDSIDPDDTVTLNEIEQYVIDHHAMDQVNQLAGNIKLD